MRLPDNTTGIGPCIYIIKHLSKRRPAECRAACSWVAKKWESFNDKDSRAIESFGQVAGATSRR
jgi:hypothetical protein